MNNHYHFCTPTPKPLLMKLLAPVTELLFLKGLPVLRDTPLVNKIPSVCGLARVHHLDFPTEEQLRLKNLTGKNQAVFFLPNHPEFFTDWMIDKYVLTRISPKAACWAAGSIVNGMGRIMQRFWLNNNLIAQLPGQSQQGKRYSVEAAMSGCGVLLHPEGQVNWSGNAISPLFPGAAEMAITAYSKGTVEVPAFQSWLAPMVWKLRFTSDVKSRLLDEGRYLEKRLELDPSYSHCPARRAYDIYYKLAVRDYRKLVDGEPSFASRHLADVRNCIIKAAITKIGNTIAHEDSDHPVIMRAAKKWLVSQNPSDSDYGAVKLAVRLYQRWIKLSSYAFADSLISQEEIAGHLKRLRADFCKNGFQDKLHNLFPQAAGSRTAHIRAVKPLAIHELLKCDIEPDPVQIMATVRQSMQRKIDCLVAELEQKTPSLKVMNPFYAAGLNMAV